MTQILKEFQLTMNRLTTPQCRHWDSLERLERHLQTTSEYTSLVFIVPCMRLCTYKQMDLNLIYGLIRTLHQLKLLGIHFIYDRILSLKLNLVHTYQEIKNIYMRRTS